MSEKRILGVPSQGQGGLESQRSGHFGHCDCFTLVEIDGMKLRFEVLVWDDLGEISRGHHERIVVNKDEFVQKTRERLQYMVERNL